MNDKEKAIALYKFLKEFSSIKIRNRLKMEDNEWYYYLKDIPNNSENIILNYRDSVETENEDNYNFDNVILSVSKPEFEACPLPDEIFREWLDCDWKYYKNTVKVKAYNQKEKNNYYEDNKEKYDENKHEKREYVQEEIKLQFENDDRIYSQEKIEFSNDENVEKFSDNEERVETFKKWMEIRDKWVERQKIIENTRNLFTDLYKVHMILGTEAESLELMLGEGYIRNSEDKRIDHPILLKRIKTEFDSKNNIIKVLDTDMESILYTELLNDMRNININSIREMMKNLDDNCYHPLDRNETPDFLKMLLSNLSGKSKFINDNESIDDVLEDELIMYLKPTIFLRKRIDGTPKTIDSIIENIEQTNEIPAHIIDIISAGRKEMMEPKSEYTLEECLASVGGESNDILLSKEANREQLEIARRIEKYNGVLVQGPPGTGKTHTIANIIGHFLSQGKRILVTSHTKKALKVLKDKVEHQLKDLCVSVLDESNVDMENSIDGITEYMSQYSSFDLEKKIESVNKKRQETIKELADTRKKIFCIMNKERNTIVVNGESFSPTQIAKFVNENYQSLECIPGEVKLNSPMPLTNEELKNLYKTNKEIIDEDEKELNCKLPDSKDIMPPQEFEIISGEILGLTNLVQSIEKKKNWRIDYNNDENVVFEIDNSEFEVSIQKLNVIKDLKRYVNEFSDVEKWKIKIIADGKKGNAFVERWITLINQINETYEQAEKNELEQFNQKVQFEEIEDFLEYSNDFQEVIKIFAQKGKISKINLKFSKRLKNTYEKIKINNHYIQNQKECELVGNVIKLKKLRNKCGSTWNDLMGKYDAKDFFSLDEDEPERIAKKFIPEIEKYLNWYKEEYDQLMNILKDIQISSEALFKSNIYDSDYSSIQRILITIKDVFPDLILACDSIEKIKERENIIAESKKTLQKEERVNSAICCNLTNAIDKFDVEIYKKEYAKLTTTFEKYKVKSIRNQLIEKIEEVAPKWAHSIKYKDGVHGDENVPEDIHLAWKCKQYAAIIAEITREPFESLQHKCIELSKEYRFLTAELAAAKAWYHLLHVIEQDIDMKQALQGWKITTKKIAKSPRSKTAPKYKAEARRLMAKCQNAVPVWIMPMSKALESFEPNKNKFDIVIIDEASQSDITALAITYYAKKVIIVGDDKQVSPDAVGFDVDKINGFNTMYIENQIPNSHLYNAKTSLYDIASTTFPSLMLREHFRCVPEIIGFSNKLSYDYKIKPLRDENSATVFPSVINYRVQDGKRDLNSKINKEEAKTIVALIMASLEEEEYQNKTYGIISLLGDEQAKFILKLLLQKISPSVIEERNILCGNAANFQGDERDIVFLSMVDSGEMEGPLSLMGYGFGDSYRKRYNVATSRAKEQLWVINSLDMANDLKSGDIRKELLEYASDPQGFNQKIDYTEINAESPFESEVAKFLIGKGYNIVQQWKAGAYRIDMVAMCGTKKIAIECDGERFHSSEDQIREDMERQTILERIGWKFIRIRGSEFYRNKENVMQRVISELNANDIYPEEVKSSLIDKSSEVFERIKIKAEQIINEWEENEKDNLIDIETIQFALS